MKYKDIKVEVNDLVGTIWFNRPEYGNAWSQNTPQEVTDALERFAADERIRSVVITGCGKHFCAGGDINRFKRLIESKVYLETPNILRAGAMAMAIRNCPKPVIAMINGAAAGAGCSVALACDFRIVTPSSKLVMAFINMGLSGDTGGLYYLQRLVGVARATELMMTGRRLDGTAAYEWGLATRLADEGQLEATTYQFARELAHRPSFAIARQKALITQYFYSDLEAYTRTEAQYMKECSHTSDFEEAVNAFLEKRAPVFQGK